LKQLKSIENHDIRRFNERKNYNVVIRFIHADKLYSGMMMNISLGGAYVETVCVNQFSIRDIITINIPFSSDKKVVKRRARIRWLNNDGFGIEFI